MATAPNETHSAVAGRDRTRPPRFTSNDDRRASIEALVSRNDLFHRPETASKSPPPGSPLPTHPPLRFYWRVTSLEQRQRLSLPRAESLWCRVRNRVRTTEKAGGGVGWICGIRGGIWTRLTVVSARVPRGSHPVSISSARPMGVPDETKGWRWSGSDYVGGRATRSGNPRSFRYESVSGHNPRSRTDGLRRRPRRIAHLTRGVFPLEPPSRVGVGWNAKESLGIGVGARAPGHQRWVDRAWTIGRRTPRGPRWSWSDIDRYGLRRGGRRPHDRSPGERPRRASVGRLT